MTSRLGAPTGHDRDSPPNTGGLIPACVLAVSPMPAFHLMRRAYCRQIPCAAASESFFATVSDFVRSGDSQTASLATKSATAALTALTSAVVTWYNPVPPGADRSEEH